MNPRDAVHKMATETCLDPDEMVRIYDEFYAECPHVEAALGYVREVAARILAEKRVAS